MLAPGTMIGSRYQVVRLLGQGGMSNIYLCDDLNLRGRRWVVKEMVARYSDPNEQRMAVELFEREAHLLASLDHRNLPKVNDFFVFKGCSYLVMEFVDGEDLGRMLNRIKGPLPERQVAELGEQMATVLYYLHCRKPHPIIFRDVKPSNIMMTGNLVKLIDFGIARHFNPSKKGDTMRIGSPGYAPPEQYSGQTDPRSDVYALGVTLHHAITGRDPTTTQTPFILPAVRDLNPSVSEDLVRIIERSTQLDPDQRYQSMIDMKRDLQALARALAGATRVVRPGEATSPVSAVDAARAVAAATVAPVAAAAAPVAASSPPAAAQAPTPPVVRRSAAGLFKWLFLLVLLGSLAAVARFNPALLEEGRQSLAAWLQSLMPRQAPRNPRDAGIQLYQEGHSLVEVTEQLRLAARSDARDPLTRIYHSNALGLSMPPPKKPARIGVLYPVERTDEVLAALAQGQEELNRVGGVGGRPVVLMLSSYRPGELQRRLTSMEAGGQSRKVNARTPGLPPEVLLIFPAGKVDAGQLASELPLFLAQASEQEDPRQMPPDIAWPVEQLARMVATGPVFSANSELAGELKSLGLSIPEFSGASGLVLARPQDLPSLKAPHESLVVLASDEAALPPAANYPGARGLIRFSPCQGEWLAASLARDIPDLARARNLDALFWVIASHYKLNALRGATLGWNRSGKLFVLPWTMVRADAGRWVAQGSEEVAAP
ncbi:serine/threonine protein kinase [bacterium CPR1]|nr:serine/threonine protein kinase [bacterium CPR1]